MNSHSLGQFIANRHIQNALIIFTVSFICLFSRMENCHEWGDEGYFANGALRVLDGEVIYRDFQHNYPPGRCYLLALLINVFGHDLLVIRLFWCFLHAGAAGLCYLASLRLMHPVFALFVSGTVLLNTAPMNKSMELMITALLVIGLFRVLERKTSFFKAGLLVGLIGHFRHDTAVFGLILLGLMLGFFFLKQRYARARGKGIEEPVPFLRSLLAFKAGFLLMLAPFALYLLYHGAMGDAINDLVFAGFQANTAMNIPFPTLITEWTGQGIWQGLTSMNVVYYIPFVLYMAGLIVTYHLIQKEGQERRPWYLAVVTLLGILLFIQVLPRTDSGHLNKAYIPAHLLGMAFVSMAFGYIVSSLKQRRIIRIATACALLLVAALFPLKQMHYNILFPRSIVQEYRKMAELEKVEFPRGWLNVADPQAVKNDFSPLFPYAGVPGEYMVVYPAGALLNCICDIPNPLKYDLLRPGELLGNDRKVISRIRRRLEETQPRFIIETHRLGNVVIRDEIQKYLKKHNYTVVDSELCDIYIRP